jgi:hypothetical protein
MLTFLCNDSCMGSTKAALWQKSSFHLIILFLGLFALLMLLLLLRMILAARSTFPMPDWYEYVPPQPEVRKPLALPTRLAGTAYIPPRPAAVRRSRRPLYDLEAIRVASPCGKSIVLLPILAPIF